MAEGLAKRVGRIVSGSINAVIDAVEDSAPEMIMEQAIREIDGAIDEVRAELGKNIAAKHMAHKNLAEKNAKYEDLSEKIEVAVSAGRDDLAEVAIARQLDIEAQIPVIEHTISECSEHEKELEAYITALQSKKREMQEELKACREVARNMENNVAGNTQNAIHQKAAGATSAFDRMLNKHGIVSGVGGVDVQNAAKIAELEALARDNRVKERLAALKSKKSGS